MKSKIGILFIFTSLNFLLAIILTSSAFAALPQQVMIEVKVVEINYDAAVSSGISWGLNADIHKEPLQFISSITAGFPRSDSNAGGINVTFGALARGG